MPKKLCIWLKPEFFMIFLALSAVSPINWSECVIQSNPGVNITHSPPFDVKINMPADIIYSVKRTVYLERA